MPIIMMNKPAGEQVLSAVGYTRVSLESQAADGVSLDMQEERIRALATARGFNLTRVIVEAGRSGKNLERPGMAELLAAIEGGCVNAVICFKVDRLTRSTRDLYQLLDGVFRRHSVALVSVTESIDTSTASGKAFIGILSVLGQLEREQVGERTRAALAHVRNTGRALGAEPFGWRRDTAGRLQIHEREQETLVWLCELRASGATLADLATRLNSAGIQGRRGGGWTATSVRRVVQRQTIKAQLRAAA